MRPEPRRSAGALASADSAGAVSRFGTSNPPSERTVLLLVGALTLLGLVLRFWHLGHWNFQATEMFTFRDSQRPQFGNPRPLVYLLNYYLVRPVLPLDEFGMRVVPAVAGSIAVPALYLLGARIVGTRAALFAALLATVNPTQILYSQLARYWSLVFLFCTIAPLALFLGVRDRSARMFALGVIATILAGLSHPVGVLAVGGPVLLFLVSLRREQVAEWWGHPAVRWGGVVLLVVLAVALARFVPLLHGWISMHDARPGYGQFLLPAQRPPGVKQLVRLTGLAEGLTVPVVLAALAGVYLVWRAGRDRGVALLLVSVAAFHLGFMLLVSLRTSVSLYYFLPSTPAFFLGAGLFLDWLWQATSHSRPRWVAPGTVTLMVLAAGVPTVISDYRDGRRFDFRGAALWLMERMGPRDLVFSDQPMVLQHYLPRSQVHHLQEDPLPLADSLRSLQQVGDARLWLVVPAPSHAFRATLKEGGLSRWIYGNCQLQNTLGRGRLDVRQHYLQIYRCPPGPPAG